MDGNGDIPALARDRPLLLLADAVLADNGSLCEQVARHGFGLLRARSGARALALARSHQPTILVIAPDLPGLNGWAVRHTLRREGCRAAILMLAPHGAAPFVPRRYAPDLDGYLPQPFSQRDLFAQIEALCRYAARRAATERGGSLLTIGPVALDPEARQAWHGDRPLALTPRAFDLLHLLMSNAGLVLVQRFIIEQIWETDWLDDTRTLDVHIRWLRREVEPNPSRPRYIYTVRGVGYRFAAPDEATAPRAAAGAE